MSAQFDRRVAIAAAVLAIPASLFASGATIFLAGLSLAGLWLVAKGATVPNRAALVYPFASAVLVAIDMLNGDPLHSLGHSLVSYLPVALVPLAAVALARVQPGPGHFAVAAVAFLTLTAIVTAAQSLSGVQRPEAVGYGSLTLGLICVLCAALALSAILASGARAILLFPPLVLALFVILVVESKIAILIALIAFPIVLSPLFRRLRPWQWIISLAAIAVLVALYLQTSSGLYLVARINGAVVAASDLFSGRMPDDRSLGLRLEMIDAGLRAFREAPWLGHGGGTQLQVASEMARPGHPYFADLATLHNDYLMHLVGYGIAGLIAFLGILSALAYTVSQVEAAYLRRFGYAALAATMAFMCVDIVLNYGPSSGVFAYLSALIFAGANGKTGLPGSPAAIDDQVLTGDVTRLR